MADDGSVSSSDTSAQLLDAGALSDIATNSKLTAEAIGNLTDAIGGLANIVLPVPSGGTGLDHVGVGDLLVGSNNNTYALFPDVAVNNALISGGVSAPPSWGKIGLTTHVSGILPIANGGTNINAFTPYAVVCGGTTSTGALQSVGSLGSTGQILTSNGASALPSFQTFVDGIGGFIPFPVNQQYWIWLISPFAMTVTNFKTRCDSGTCSALLWTDGPINIATNAVSTTTVNTSVSVSRPVGANFLITISSTSNCANMSFMVQYTRP